MLTDEFFHGCRSFAAGTRHRRSRRAERMKKLARMFYGRAAAYGDALDARRPRCAGRSACAAMSGPTARAGRRPAQLAAYVAWRTRRLAAQPTRTGIAAGSIFPVAG